ncbi:MAG: M23 family metallopeptidase [Oscillospiraceae bacterium]|nr:M23 family metallopeptidase [Oscillospiraceae bacterium]
MSLFDKKINELSAFWGIEENFSVFSDFSEASGKAINKVLYVYETIKDNIEGIYDNAKPINSFILSSGAKQPIKSWDITSQFGKRKSPFTGRQEIHSGIDIAAAEGSFVYPSWPGKIIETGYDDIYGNYIIIRHSEDFFTKYCHLSKITADENEFINIDEVIGKVGSTGYSTGSHLHLEVIIEGRKIDPLECFEL